MSSFSKRTFFRKSKKSPRAVKKSPRPAAKRMPRMSFTKRVSAVIARNVENKFTTLKLYSAPVGNVQNTGVANVYNYTHYTWAPGQQTDPTTQQMFNIPQGVAQNQRVGNSIKLKRWVIKGMVSPNVFGILAPYTALGYVDVYFGRLKLNTKEITNQVSDLYQNGSTSFTPAMRNIDMLCPINRDIYKIYYHRRFKTGTSGVNAATNLPLASEPVNNDYKLTHTFGFDVCKYILKDRKITFSDTNNTPLDIDVGSLTLFAIFTPFTGQAFNNTTAVGGLLPTYMTLSATSYAEYEDA